MLDQHFLCNAGDGFLQLPIPLGAIHQLIKDQRLPPLTDLVKRIGHRTGVQHALPVQLIRRAFFYCCHDTYFGVGTIYFDSEGITLGSQIKKDMKYVLLGSLGNITKPLAQQLIAAGQQVTIVSSDPTKAAAITALGATPVIGSVEDTQFLTNTLKGADAAYMMIPPKLDAPQWKQWIGGGGGKDATAPKAARVEKGGFLSSNGPPKTPRARPAPGIHFSRTAPA